MEFFFGFLLTVLAIFLILLVLVQRGRGGGLAGALGGMGGSSAFGAKAGDMFTRITIVVVAIWITVCIIAGHWAKRRDRDYLGKSGEATTTGTLLPPSDAAKTQGTAEQGETPPATTTSPVTAPPATTRESPPSNRPADGSQSQTPPADADK
jgi:preprotein translocase subunit SecG